MKRVVVTGIGVVSPIGNTLSDYWDSLIHGVCGIDFITRFDTREFKVKIGAEVKHFDPSCALDKSDLKRTDLFAQYALVSAHQAMQDAKLHEMDPWRFGVYVGSGIGGMTTFEEEHSKLLEKGNSRVSPFFIPKMIGNMASGLIAMKYNAKGPCLPVVTACSTGTHALGEAYLAIASDRADVILAGGTESAITPLSCAGFVNCMALSTSQDPLRSSIPFDAERNGFVMGEGSGILVLEEYEHAKKRGATMYAEICGYGNTCDAYHMTAPLPDASSAAKAMELALKTSGASSEKLIYINAHGTSTPLNDKTETMAIKKAFGPMAHDLMVSSTKSMMGHCLGAAGALEAIASILALQHQMIPPTIGYQKKDPDCDLDYVPNEAREASITHAFSNSLGFGGHNACLAMRRLEEQ